MGLRYLPLLFFIVFCFKNTKAKAYDTSQVHQMLLFLKSNQSEDCHHFPKGIFPSYRQYSYRPEVLKDDDNLFFTGLIVFTLNEIYPHLSTEDQKIVRAIRNKAIPAFALYKNQKGMGTYNFWQTRPPKIFPNSGWMNWFDKPQALPDDFDDTAIGLLASAADTQMVEKIHAYMQKYRNGSGRRIKNTRKAYQNISAYSVWFGKKFPIDFDICVLANTLYLVSAYKLTWTQADSASLTLIKTAIRNDDIQKHPASISPHYHTTAIILYHLSRLMVINPAILSEYRTKLIVLCQSHLKNTKNPIEKAMLSTTLKRLGCAENNNNVSNSSQSEIAQYAQNGFVFFIANMASMLPNPFKSIFSKWQIGQFNYYCPAYNIALILENKLTSINEQ